MEQNTNLAIFEAEETRPYCSMRAETMEQKEHLFHIMNNPDSRLGDHINEVIMVKDVFCEIVNLTNETTGEINSAPRIVLIDTAGKSYACVSQGIYGAIAKLMRVFGPPTWEDGLKIKVKQLTKGERKILTLDI